jgi:apolipoprotein N-acyltransferase
VNPPNSPVISHAIALAAGAALACAFAPLNAWWMALISPALLMWLWEGSTPRRAAWNGLLFGSGTFGLGTWWLYVSVHGFGGAPIWLTLAIVLGLVVIMGAYHALMGFLAVRFLPAAGAARYFVGLPAIWLLTEWCRGWFLSGFPWLTLGSSQTDTWLGGFAPITGAYGISLVLLLGSGSLLALQRSAALRLPALRAPALALLLLPWPLGWALGLIDWTQPAGPPVTVAVLQGAIPQDQKWQADNVEPTRDLYTNLDQQALGAQLIVWPESALPQLANEVPQYLGQLYSQASARGSDIVMGIIRADDGDNYYNSIMTMARNEHVTFYDKHHLVPFAEFFPVPSFVRSWLRLMSLPYSDFTPGADVQPAVAAGGTMLSLSICYEDAYGTSNLSALEQARLLVNVTNDAWFGRSWARYQHFQISRMRAMEARRPLVRAANDGISALVGARGEVLARAPEFQSTVLRGTVQPRAGLPPFARFGNIPVVLLALAGFGLLAARQVRVRRQPT